MPRFFFHFEDSHKRYRDDEGVLLPDAEAAWYQAVRSAREVILCRRVPPGSRPFEQVYIEDEQGKSVTAVPFDELVGIAI